MSSSIVAAFFSAGQSKFFKKKKDKDPDPLAKDKFDPDEERRRLRGSRQHRASLGLEDESRLGSSSLGPSA
jgi:hypothetical protein